MIAPIWLFLADVPPAVLVAAMAAAGLANGLINAPLWTIFTVRTPPQLRAKAWAAIIATTSIIAPVAVLGTGPALDSIGLTETLLAIVVVQTAAALVFMVAGLRERFRPLNPSLAPALSETPHRYAPSPVQPEATPCPDRSTPLPASSHSSETQPHSPDHQRFQ
jgi:hypothetical protein